MEDERAEIKARHGADGACLSYRLPAIRSHFYTFSADFSFRTLISIDASANILCTTKECGETIYSRERANSLPVSRTSFRRRELRMAAEEKDEEEDKEIDEDKSILARGEPGAGGGGGFRKNKATAARRSTSSRVERLST